MARGMPKSSRSSSDQSRSNGDQRRVRAAVDASAYQRERGPIEDAESVATDDAVGSTAFGAVLLLKLRDDLDHLVSEDAVKFARRLGRVRHREAVGDQSLLDESHRFPLRLAEAHRFAVVEDVL